MSAQEDCEIDERAVSAIDPQVDDPEYEESKLSEKRYKLAAQEQCNQEWEAKNNKLRRQIVMLKQNYQVIDKGSTDHQNRIREHLRRGEEQYNFMCTICVNSHLIS